LTLQQNIKHRRYVKPDPYHPSNYKKVRLPFNLDDLEEIEGKKHRNYSTPKFNTKQQSIFKTEIGRKSYETVDEVQNFHTMNMFVLPHKNKLPKKRRKIDISKSKLQTIPIKSPLLSITKNYSSPEDEVIEHFNSRVLPQLSK
jgi:hypothetical protein